MPDIVSIGECLIELFSDEPLRSAPSFRKSFAGDTLNMLAMASRLGTSCGYMTRLGDDPFADYLLDSWHELKIDTAAVKRGGGFTGMHFISLLPDGQRDFLYYRRGSATSALSPGDLDPEYIAAAKLLHVSAILQGVSQSCRETVLHAVRIAHERGVPISYDTNLRLNMWAAEEAREAVDEVLPYADIVFPSHPEETQALLGVDSPLKAIETLHARGARTIAVKGGGAGAWVGTEDGRVARVAAVAPRGVADTTGAGDAFVGGFLHAMLQGMDAFEGARWGVAAAGLKVAGRGAIVSQPAREEVEALLPSARVDILDTD